MRAWLCLIELVIGEERGPMINKAGSEGTPKRVMCVLRRVMKKAKEKRTLSEK